jgi:hypothetical protein
MALPMALEQYRFQPLLLGGVALFAGILFGPRGIGGFVADLARTTQRVVAAEGPRALLTLLRMPGCPSWMHIPDRSAARAYRNLRAEVAGFDLWSTNRRDTVVS